MKGAREERQGEEGGIPHHQQATSGHMASPAGNIKGTWHHQQATSRAHGITCRLPPPAPDEPCRAACRTLTLRKDPHAHTLTLSRLRLSGR